MNTRRAYVDLIYNGTAATAEISGFVTDISYTDPASGEADSLDITLQDRDHRWTGAWIPVAGDTLAATIRALNCQYSGDNRILPCGFFIVDSFSFSGWPVSGSISAISTPLDSSFTTTQRTKTWENVTIKEIGTEIAGRAGIALAWDVEGAPFTIKSVEQSEQTDCEFYMNLCNTYGLAMKVYAQKIVVYDREAYKKKGAAAVLSPSSMKSWSWQQDQAGTYTGGEFTYTSPATEKEIKVTDINPGQIDEVNACGLNTGLYELQLLDQKKVLAQKQTKLAKDAYLPTVSLTGNLMYSAYTDKFENWFRSGDSNHWYGSNGIGIQVRVPIFDGFGKRSKIKKAKAEEESARLGYEDAYKKLQANYMNAVSEVNNCQRNYKKQYDNYTLAQDVYNVTAYQYKEGVTSMTVVLQDEMRISEAMNNYLNAYYRYKVANLSLLKLTGQLEQLK